MDEPKSAVLPIRFRSGPTTFPEPVRKQSGCMRNRWGHVKKAPATTEVDVGA